jgi:lysophospholipase L1-like esterase
MVFEGVNDIGTAATDPASQKNVGDRLIAAFIQITTRLRTDDITVFAATITPFSAPSNFTGQPYSDPEREKTRQRVNKWIRESNNFDEVIDFDAWLRNPKIPSQLADQYNSGDYLHPNVAGYQRIADKFPLNIF